MKTPVVVVVAALFLVYPSAWAGGEILPFPRPTSAVDQRDWPPFVLEGTIYTIRIEYPDADPPDPKVVSDD